MRNRASRIAVAPARLSRRDVPLKSVHSISTLTPQVHRLISIRKFVSYFTENTMRFRHDEEPANAV
jgi:hypothetical protein